jgi:meso-butanediol dehydrogenase / (S,S)-butanediol dehydrogenase / diacetyl reductase
VAVDIRRVALVTGAAGDLGQAIVRQLVVDGFAVGLSDLPVHEDTLRSFGDELGSETVVAPADVTDRADLGRATSLVASRFGRFDVMINNAGISQVRPLLELTADDLNRMFSTNINGVVFGIQAAAERFRELGVGGTIISAASIAGFRPNPDLAHYSASKFAVRSITQSAARSLASYGITVNGYAPGIVDSDMWTRIDADLAQSNGKGIGQNLSDAVRGIPLGRPARASDVADVVSFLASPKASYMTGQVVVVDGGLIYH